MSKEFWKAAAIRAVRTMAQAALALIPAAATITEVNWLTVLGTAALAGVVSILTSVATGLPETEPVIEYRYLDENGVPVDGHYMLVHNIEEEECEACDLTQYIAEGEPKGGDGDETA